MLRGSCAAMQVPAVGWTLLGFCCSIWRRHQCAGVNPFGHPNQPTPEPPPVVLCHFAAFMAEARDREKAAKQAELFASGAWRSCMTEGRSA